MSSLSQKHTPFSSPKLYALGVPPYVGCMGPSVVAGWLCGWSVWLGWPLVQLVVRPCLVQRLSAAGWWGHVTRQLTAEPQGAPGLVLAHWWVKPGPGVSASLLAGRARSWSLVAGPRDPRASVGFLGVGSGVLFLTQFSVGSGVSWSLCWPASGQGWALASPRAGSGLLLEGWIPRLWDCGFLASSICPLVGEAGPEARTGSLQGRTRVQGFLGLVPAHWLVELGPGPSGRKGRV